MKIAILSDLHFGFGVGTERETDAYEAAEEMMKKAMDCDVILIAGDMFDTRVPRTEDLVKSMQLLTWPMHADNDVRISGGVGKDADAIPLIKTEGIPVVAIHGTHERRTRGLLNPVEALEKAGFLIYLHCNGIVLEKGEERVCIQGLSGVPDQFAENVLDQWKPVPIDGCFNIFMLHQSMSPFMFATHLLPVERLPRGFDLYICGHMHDPQKTVYASAPFIIPGAPVITQITKESVNPAGLWIFDTESKQSNIIPLESHRKAYYREIDSQTGFEGIESEISRILTNHQGKKPLIRFKITGKERDLPLDEIKTRFQDEAIVSFRKATEGERIEAKSIEEHKLSVQELGKKLLDENLGEAKLDPRVFEHVFELMEEGRMDDVMDYLRKSLHSL